MPPMSSKLVAVTVLLLAPVCMCMGVDVIAVAVLVLGATLLLGEVMPYVALLVGRDHLDTADAQSRDCEVAETHLEAERFPDLCAHAVELRRGNAFDSATALAHEVLECAVAGERVETRPVAQVHVTHDAQALEPFEVAVDRCQVGASEPSLQTVRDVLGRNGTLRRK
jgi:hypothetical protein